ncbi:hypothetical protein BU26DRAFT_570111 [Trematosphaeria pertusa]|uniref:Lytic polysaccharide monooxygenase n=1 Tax=Trematosphaeria pertusa TaxID=390896 RepID=A0A6A6HZG4_9PLEO|nr:uncharacterized protein BU26DRAFT_570111 [Trematosphaeria pertusa]KAF2243416.1 hypothetical protein BU26DRAFT_570111 [Trematosphaeria pertusa]
MKLLVLISITLGVAAANPTYSAPGDILTSKGCLLYEGCSTPSSGSPEETNVPVATSILTHPLLPLPEETDVPVVISTNVPVLITLLPHPLLSPTKETDVPETSSILTHPLLPSSEETDIPVSSTILIETEDPVTTTTLTNPLLPPPKKTDHNPSAFPTTPPTFTLTPSGTVQPPVPTRSEPAGPDHSWITREQPPPVEPTSSEPAGPDHTWITRGKPPAEPTFTDPDLHSTKCMLVEGCSTSAEMSALPAEPTQTPHPQLPQCVDTHCPSHRNPFTFPVMTAPVEPVTVPTNSLKHVWKTPGVVVARAEPTTLTKAVKRV